MASARLDAFAANMATAQAEFALLPEQTEDVGSGIPDNDT